MGSRNGAARDLWIRLGLFAAGYIGLSLVLMLAYRGLSGDSLLGGSSWPVSVFSVLSGVPLLGAAALAWFLPRTAVSAATGPVRPMSRIFVLSGVALGLMVLLSFAFSGISSWSTSSGLAGTVTAPLSRVSSGFVGSLVTCVAVFGVLVPLWRRVLSPAWSGMASALTVQAPLLLATLIGAAFAVSSAPGLVGMAFLELLVKAAVWGVLYAGLARLVDGRPWWQAVLLAGLALACVSAAARSLDTALQLLSRGEIGAVGFAGLGWSELALYLVFGWLALSMGRDAARRPWGGAQRSAPEPSPGPAE